MLGTGTMGFEADGCARVLDECGERESRRRAARRRVRKRANKGGRLGEQSA